MILLPKQHRCSTAAFFLSLAIAAGPAWAQQAVSQQARTNTPARPGSISVNEAIELTNGWALLAQGMPDEAAARAAKVLAAYPRSAAALVLAVEAETARGGSGLGLSQYEKWLGQRTFEEPSVVRRIAVAVLKEQAQDDRPGAARLEALRALAADGDDAALKQLSAATVEGSAPETRVLASLGNEAAVRVLVGNLDKGGNVPAAIEALAESGSRSAIAPLTARLKDSSPEIRAAAVEGLGRLGRRYDLAASIQPVLNDEVAYVRVKAAAALFSLGDMSGMPVLEQLLADDAAVSRLMAAQAMASQPNAEWQDRVRRLTLTAEPEVRVGAARLLVLHDPELARKVLDGAMTDPNPAIREMAGEGAIELTAGDLRALRHALKSTNPLAQVRAASRILVLVR